MDVLPCERDTLWWYLDFCDKKELEEYRKDPSKFLKDIFGIELLPCQEAFIKSIIKENSK